MEGAQVLGEALGHGDLAVGVVELEPGLQPASGMLSEAVGVAVLHAAADHTGRVEDAVGVRLLDAQRGGVPAERVERGGDDRFVSGGFPFGDPVRVHPSGAAGHDVEQPRRLAAGEVDGAGDVLGRAGRGGGQERGLLEAESLDAVEPVGVDHRGAFREHGPSHRGPAAAEVAGHLGGAATLPLDLLEGLLAGPFGLGHLRAARG